MKYFEGKKLCFYEIESSPRSRGIEETGNYRKDHVRIDGYDVTIENPKGSERSGTDANGHEWRQTMHNTYGYIRGTEGVDGDHIDVFLSDTPESGNVFVVDQVNKDGSFDEHKVLYGFNSVDEAREAYLSNYEEGWQGLGAITEVSKDEFKKWIDSSHRKTKPFAEYKSVKASGSEQGERQNINTKDEGTELESQRGGAGTGTAMDRVDTSNEDASGDAAGKGSVQEAQAAAGSDGEADNGESGVSQGVSGADAGNGRADGGVSVSGEGGSALGNMPFAPADDSAPLASHRGKRGKMTDAEKKREDALRDAVVGLQRGIGIEVNTDWKEGQKVLDVDRKRQARMMGTTTRNRQKLIGKILSEKETTKTQEAIVSVFSGKSQVETIAFEDASKKQRLIRFVQGHDQKAGVKHSVFRHYGTNKNGYTADELLLIPDVLSRGLRKQDGNRVSYSLDNDGVKYTVTTLQKSTGEEIFTNFYTNKKPTTGLNGTSNTATQQVPPQSILGAKLQKKSGTPQESEIIFGAAKKLFGVTGNIREAGYVLPDGTMLDFSGRHLLDEGTDSSFLRGRRAVDHRDISSIAYERDGWTETGLETDMPDFIRRGAVRVDAICGTINLAVKPTAKQKSALRQLVALNRGSVCVDFGDGWDSNHYAEYDDAKPARVVADIERYFEEGIKPSGNIQFFRTSNGEAYGFTLNGKIYLDPRIATAETPIHEYGHLWTEALRNVNPEAWEHLKEQLLGEKDVLEYVKGLYPELEGDELMDEVFQHYAGRRGAERLRTEYEAMMAENKDGVFGAARITSLFDKIRRALKRYWEMARDLFAGNNARLKDMSAEDFADAMMADLMNGVKRDGGETGMKLQRGGKRNRSERDDIASKAKEAGTYMKAPNGEATKLTEDQWVTVRTDAFKEWLGDWEKVHE